MKIAWYLFFKQKGMFKDCGEELNSKMKIKPEIS
jgi:hypothetical protein